ncbi:hypothetical protein LUZ61_005832 [Rhynchospora tenuis]|uniref:Dirigent protein n=1 Tax=Rhynchospora tenuis TaxID=198213 RepID=A0AAD5ZQG9_9POAL|nr:hypothetical protein LUZ61_005832 [Rhynchospora tenuis]
MSLEPGKIQIFPTTKNLKINLYMRQITQGPNKNQILVINPNSKFGEIVVNDWRLYDSRDGGNLIARFQGPNINASVDNLQNEGWYISSNLLFVGGSYKDSTLQVMGVFQTNNWSIVGGTGEFSKASGNLIMSIEQEATNLRVMKIAISATYTPPKQAA